MRRNKRASDTTGRLTIQVTAWFCFAICLQPVGPLHAHDAFYQTLKPSTIEPPGFRQSLMPPLFPPSPAPTNQPGICSQLLANLRTQQVGRVQATVIMSDEPRQAAMSVLQYPCLGVTLAGHALSAGMESERKGQVTCVDLYFEAIAFSWHFLQSPHAALQPEYSTAWSFYHQGLARLLETAQRFGRLDPSTGLRVLTPTGMQTIPTSYHGFVWNASDFTRIEVVYPGAPHKLKNYYRCPGLGVPLVVLRQHKAPDRFLLDETPFGATAILRPSLAAMAGQAPPMGASSSHGPLEFYDPLRVGAVEFGRERIAMAADTSAALEYAIREGRVSAWIGLIEPGSAEAGQEKLFLLEPYQSGKYPVVLVHGFLSSPRIWAQFANEIMARPELRNRVQLLAYRYPTGRPFTESAAILRRELLALKETFDPRGEDPGIANSALIGHSMGGLVCKLAVTHSDDRLWCSVANRPLDDINVSDRQRRALRDMFYFQPVPFVRRVVFLGTPHDGSQLASRGIGRLGAHCVQLPSAERIEHAWMIKQNPGVFSPELAKRIPTSIDMMEPSSPLLHAIQTLCPGENVQLHNIVGVGCWSPLEGIGDGVVARESAQHPCVSTEKRVHATHTALHEDDAAMKELLCIIRRHILEANDVPSIDGYEFAAPELDCPQWEDLPGTQDPCLVDPCLVDPCLIVPDSADPCPPDPCLLFAPSLPDSAATEVPVEPTPAHPLAGNGDSATDVTEQSVLLKAQEPPQSVLPAATSLDLIQPEESLPAEPPFIGPELVCPNSN